MLGAIAGDIIGSVFEFHPVKTVEFELFSAHGYFTDDTVLTVATAFSLLTDGDYRANYRLFGRLYPKAGYGARFDRWLHGPGDAPYGSLGNGSAMRVAPIGFAFDDEDRVLAEAARSAAVTHDHPEGIKGAQAVALGILLARQGVARPEIGRELGRRFGYDLSRTPDLIRPGYGFDETCPGSVAEAISCFLAAADWDHAVRLAVSLGGDADTQACIAGALAEASFAGLPPGIAAAARGFLPEHLLEIVDEFLGKYPGPAPA